MAVSRMGKSVLLIISVLINNRVFVLGADCDFETRCSWEWKPLDSFEVVSAANLTDVGIQTDAEGNTNGSFLYHSTNKDGTPSKAEITSPWLNDEKEAKCKLEVALHMYNMINGSVEVLLKSLPNITIHSTSIAGDNGQKWNKNAKIIGPITHSFRLALEIIHPSGGLPGHVAIDNIRVRNCHEEESESQECHYPNFLCPESKCENPDSRCSERKCIPRNRVCDITKDCPGGEDEQQECDKIPRQAYCDFEEDTCSWKSKSSDVGRWVRKQGSMSSGTRGDPFYDHTYNNASGHYMRATFSQSPTSSQLLAGSIHFNSEMFRPPPRYHRSQASQYYNSCQVRFVYHTIGRHPNELVLNCISMDENHPNGHVTQIFRAYEATKRKWFRGVRSIPPDVTRNFYLQFTASRGYRGNDLAIDDISLSPECFGIGVKDEVLPPLKDNNATAEPKTSKFYHFDTCGSKGPFGPSQHRCSEAYKNSSAKVTVIEGKIPMAGVQKWTVPETGIYAVIARGASGSTSLDRFQGGRGAFVRGTFDWNSGDVIYILVGQKGTDPLGLSTDDSTRRGRRPALKILRAGIGGAGGGGTFVFKKNSHNNYVPLLIAAGGGGSSDEDLDDEDVHGKGYNESIVAGNGFSPADGAGGGGGWNGSTTIDRPSAGQSLLEGGHGGESCRSVKDLGGQGGFGGGGGACVSGGGGGGYRGGSAPIPDTPSKNGQGGTSYINPRTLYSFVESGKNEGDGSVDIIPAQPGCGCEYLCVRFDLEAKDFHCICPPGDVLKSDGLRCKDDMPDRHYADGLIPTHHIVLIILFMAIAVVLIIVFIYMGVNRYKKQSRDLSHEPLNNAEVQLNRLRQSGGGMVTEYNPNYEFGGSTCTIQDLPQIPRDQLTLVKALGQGAFGEVYQGYLAGRGSEAEEIPIAVKTLPELSSNQAEMDFLMEALIMSKFNHPNIVKFIGVCFEKMPRFIVLELLPGGDLKSFLRESRPKPHKPSNLTMTDLLNLSLDVAKGCQYLEENHFIHRDIAARNCLLTTKNPGRVVKIADFGMARDIYRADYYRKGGKAMLPVKWMPPEAFLDGMFTTKTDVWSFGVLLWEVMSLGYMPYPGWGNQEVMQLVTSGGRLEPPNNCPNQIYHIMMRCWHPIPDERPNFTTIIERLGYCLQDPDVTSAPLPIFHRPPSMERDATVMRPPDSENSCLQIQRPEMLSPGSEDYLIPMPSSNYSLATDNTELQSSPSVGSIDQLLELEETSSNRRKDNSNTSTKETTLSHPPFDKKGYTPVSVKGSRDRLSSSDSLEALPVAPSVDRSQKGSPNLALDVEALQRQSANQQLRYINVTDTNPSSSPAYDGVNPVA